jgi:hypothetical protein
LLDQEGVETGFDGFAPGRLCGSVGGLRLGVLVVSLVCSLGCGLFMWSAVAEAARGHVFSTTFGTEGSGAGELREPMGVAVNEATTGPTAGDVYVADFGNNRVQWFSFNAGTKTYEVAGQITAADGSGTGTLTEGSSKIESLATTSGAFVVGQTISGVGIPAETKIAAVEPFGVIEISSPVEAGKSGALVALSAAQPLVEPRAITVDNSPSGPSAGDVYVSSGESPSLIDKFTASGEFVGQITHTPEASAFVLVRGLAVDPAGTLWVLEAHTFGEEPSVDHFSGGVANEFQPPSCVPPVATGAAWGLAVDAKDNLYVQTETTQSRGHGGVVELDPQCKVLNQTLDTESSAAEPGVTFFGVAVEPSSGEAYVDNIESVGRFAAKSGVEVERFGAGDLAAAGCNELVNGRASCLGGVAVNGAAAGPTAGDVYAAVGSGARIVVFALESPAVPRVQGESVVKLTDNSVTLQAEINPRSVPAEAGTEYHFEYGPCPGAPVTCAGSGYPSSTAGSSLPPGFDFAGVSAPVEGLHAGVTYHFRLVASNAHGAVQGSERTFTASAGGEFSLPDARQWEMVSPQAMHGALVEPLGGGTTTQAAAGGGGLAFATNAPTEPEPVGYAGSPEVLSTRGAAGWSSHDVGVPHAVTTGLASNALEVRIFSADLSLAAVQPLGSFIALSEDASEQTAYLRDNASGVFAPLVTGCPAAPTPCSPAIQAHADVPPGTVFGNTQSLTTPELCPPAKKYCGPQFVGATPDLAHVILTATTPLTPGANALALYEWSAGRTALQQLRLVSLLPPVIPGGEELPAPNPLLGFITGPGGGVSPDQRGAVSADGARVFFTSQGHLYMRDTVAPRTVQVDVPCGTCGGGVQGPEFQFASSDGSRVFFTDTQKLTADGREYPGLRKGSQGADLYVCEVHEDACALTDLAPSGAVVGELPGASEDGSWVYFAANGALAPGAISGACVNGAPSAITISPSVSCDLYGEHYAGGAWGQPRVVAVLSAEDQMDWWEALDGMVARVSPSGGWLAFTSQRSLTGYDNRDAVSGKPDNEVYLYEAAHGRLTCASCDPSGARPHGVEYGENGQNVPLLGNAQWTAQTWIAASVPAWVNIKENYALYQPRYLSDSGRLFFDSHDALVPKDVNGTGDVYEYQPAGVPEGPHACSPASGSGGVVFRAARPFEAEGEELAGEEGAGCVGLVSSGSSGEESAFLDASETGGDVFFVSTARLSPLDVEGGLTVYDAHECTGVSPCIVPPSVSPPACSTEASCKAAPSPQPGVFGLSGSATFSGPGNPAPPRPPVKTPAQIRAEKLRNALKQCHKDKEKSRRQRCEKQARSKYAAKKSAKKASTNRRPGQ